LPYRITGSRKICITGSYESSTCSITACCGNCCNTSTTNTTGTAATITVSYYNAAAIGGTGFAIVGNMQVPANSTINVIDKSSQYYLEENSSLGATAGTANALVVTTSYEDIS